MTAVIGPLAAFAFVPRLLDVTDGERATPHRLVRGAPQAPTMQRSRGYTRRGVAVGRLSAAWLPAEFAYDGAAPIGRSEEP